MSSFRWIPWTQPTIHSDTEYGVVSASSINGASTGTPAFAWRASDGLREGGGCSWESTRDTFPAWWRWAFPATLRITHLKLYNKFSSYSYLTKNVSVYADADMGRLITKGQFECAAFSELSFDFDEPIITGSLWVVCEDSYMPSNTYVGLGEVEITAMEGILQYEVRFLDWDGTALKSEALDAGGSVSPPPDPVREGYKFDGWSEPTTAVTSDMTVKAQYSPLGDEDKFLLTTLRGLLGDLAIPVETGVFSETPPDCYVVLTPLVDTFELFADNRPEHEVQEVRISLFDKGSYLRTRGKIVEALLSSEITITDRRYIAHEDDTGYHHSAIDVAQVYNMEE